MELISGGEDAVSLLQPSYGVHKDQLSLWSFSTLLISEQLQIHGGPYFASRLPQLEQDRAVRRPTPPNCR